MRTTVLNADMTPTGEISVQEAIVKIVLDKAYAVENYPNKVFRSMELEIPAPKAIAVFQYIQLPDHYYGPAPLTNRNLFLRDDYSCQYCGRGRGQLDNEEFLSRDHVVPISQGGKDRWKNCVTACISCNHRKADRTPEGAAMEHPGPLKVPKLHTIYQLRRERRERYAVS